MYSLVWTEFGFVVPNALSSAAAVGGRLRRNVSEVIGPSAPQAVPKKHVA